MNWAHIALLLAAGLVGGLTGSIAGLASVATYPALLAVGLPPVTANITNTVALVGNAVGSIIGSRPELRGQGRFLLRTAPMAALGGVLGAVLLLSTPAEGFERLVPLLIGFSSIAILWPRRERGAEEDAPRRHRSALILQAGAIFLIAIYGGYFGAAAGVLLLALLLRAGGTTLAHANASKNVLLGASNGAAAIIFVVVAPVHWPSLIPLAIGCIVGSRLGPVVVRHAPATPLRWLIGAGGLALAIKLGLDAY